MSLHFFSLEMFSVVVSLMGIGERKGPGLSHCRAEEQSLGIIRISIIGRTLTVCARQAHVIFFFSQCEFIFLIPRINKLIKISTSFFSGIN